MTRNKVVTIDHADLPVLAAYPVPGCEVTGLRSATFVGPEDYSLWLCRAELEPGAEMVFGSAHGDHGIHVVAGELVVGDEVCPAGGAVIVESGVAVTISSPTGASILHNGPADPAPPADGLLGPPRAEGHRVHVIGPKGWYQAGKKEKVESIWFADSTCPTCRIAMFTVSRGPVPGRVGRPHYHSADELIHIISGSLRMGSQHYGAGTSVIIPANVRYAVSGDDSLKFLNYRRDTATQTFLDQEKETEPETALGRGGIVVDDVVHVQVG